MMQRTFTLIASLFSLAFLNVCAPIALAQSGGAVEPSEKPQEIDEHVAGQKPLPAAVSSRRKGETASAAKTSGREQVLVPVGETRSNVDLQGKDLVVRGTAQEIKVTDGDVIVEPGGRLEGTITCVNGQVRYLENRTAQETEPPLLASPHPYSRIGWVFQQAGVLLLGLLGCGLMVMAAPNAAVKTSRLVLLEPGRCLLLGTLGGVGLGIIGWMNSLLLHTPLRLLWSPFGFVAATLSLLLLAFGWLCGMRRLGDLAALRFGRAGQGGFAERIALGLVCAFALTTFAGLISPALGGVALLVQWGFAFMGLGGVILSRLRGETE